MTPVSPSVASSGTFPEMLCLLLVVRACEEGLDVGFVGLLSKIRYVD